jgi:hypothetical protein
VKIRRKTVGHLIPFLALLSVWEAHAREPNPLVRKWNQQLQTAVGQLRAGQPQAAFETTDRLLGEMTKKVVPGDGSGKAFAMGLTLKALAEASLGQVRVASWHWQVAQQLDPAMESWNLSDFGAAAEILARHRLSADPPPDAIDLEAGDLNVVKPQRREREYDRKYPGVAKRLPNSSTSSMERGMDDGLVIVVVIGVDGLATHPRFARQPNDLALAVSGADFLLHSEFEPAKRDGVPVASRYRWSLNLRFVR